MKARNVYIAMFSVAIVIVILGSLGSVGIVAAQTEVQTSASGSMSNRDIDLEAYHQMINRISHGAILTEVEKQQYLDFDSRYRSLEEWNHRLDNHGGPDAYSYFFVDNVTPDTATYNWIELDGAPDAVWLPASAFSSTDDGYSYSKLPLGFSFPFYGTPHDSVRVTTNGVLEFNVMNGSQINTCLPTANINAPIIAVFWDDLHLLNGGIPSGNNVIGYKRFPNYTVIEFDSIGFYLVNDSTCSFEAILFPNGNIKFQYRTLHIPASFQNSATIGLQDSGAVGSPALNYACDTTAVQPTSGLAIWFFRPTGIPRPVTNLQGSVAGTDVTLTWTDPSLDTQGNPLTPTNIQVWLGPVGTGTLLATVPAGQQSYTHSGAPSGNITYNVRAYHNPYYGTPASVTVLVGAPSYNQNFDSTNGGWVRTPANGGWEWGTPLAPPGPTPHSGTNVWGTVLGGYYIDNACWQLDLSLNRVVQSSVATVEFWCWYNIQSFYDGCNFKVSVDGGLTWTVAMPEDGYPTQAISTTTPCIGGQPAWTGITPEWMHVVIPIGQYVGQTPIFRFEFGSNSFTTAPGFYFDDFQVWGLQSPVGVPRAPANLAAIYNTGPNNVVLTWIDPSQDLSGNPITPDSAQIWLGPAVSGQLLGSVAATVQTFTHSNPAWGSHQTYTVRAYDAPFFGAPASISLQVGNPTYNNNFNVDNGMWVPTPPTDGWSWGAPTNGSAPPPHSPSYYWGTGLTANYTDGVCWQLDVNLGLVVQSAGATVEFWYRYNCEQNYDGCNLKASVDGGSTFTVLTPSQGAYTVPALSTANTCMGGQPAWSGQTQTDWQYAVIPIGQFIGQAPIFRLEFSSDPSVSGFSGFFFDDVVIWGLAQPQMASIAGTVTLNGGTGAVTNATVLANGIGAPSVHPLANGTYTLAGVQVGNRVITTTLAGYDTARLNVNVTVGGLTNQNMTIRRLPPPAPTGLVSTLNSITGRDSLWWSVSPDLLVDGYKLYDKMRDSTIWHYRKTVYGRSTHNWGIDTLAQAGIWLYAVTAIDTGVTGGAASPVESPRSDPTPPQIFGSLPPVALVANGNFDNKIQLSWLAPGTPPEHELYYDSAGSNPGCITDGLGFNSQFPFAWFAGHYQVTGAVTITRIKTTSWPQSAPGCSIQMGVFEDDGTGLPTFTPLSATDATITNPSGWTDVELSTPVTVNSGSFFAGIRQVTAQRVDIGMDECAVQHPNTFYAATVSTGPWTELGSAGFPQVLAIRCIVIGGGAATEVELEPTPVGHVPMMGVRGPTSEKKSSGKWPVADVSKVQATTPSAFSAAVGQNTIPVSAMVSKHVGVTTYDGKDNHRGRNPLDAVTKYIIYRDGARRDSVLPTILVYNDTPLPENQTHQYYVIAQYDNINLSGPSNTVSAACNMPPAAPANVSCTPIGLTQARISWTPPTTNADGTALVDLAGYRVYRDGTQIGTTSVGTNVYTDTPPSPTTFYTWSIKAVDEVPNLSDAGSVTCAPQSPWVQVPFGWVDISANGTGTSADDDIISGPFPLGFTFPYYGGSYTQVKICSNGWITFDPNETSVVWTETAIPSTALPNCALYPYWDDMDADPTTGGGVIKYYADAANNRFIIAWLGVYRYSTTDPQTFEVIIDADGSITFNYQTISVNTSCTAGVENCDGTQALQLVFDGAGPYLPTSNTSVQFWGGPHSGVEGIVRAQSPSIPIQNCMVYLVGQPDTVTTDAGGSYTIGAEPGTYTVCFRHAQYCDTCYAGVVVVDATFTTRNAVMRQAVATFNVTSINRSLGINLPARTDSFSLQNTGGPCPLNFSITDSATWITESPTAGSVPAAGRIWIHYTYGPFTTTGIFTSSIMVSYIHASGSPYRIPVTIQALTAEEPGNGLPTEFALHQNYPNPFNASTAIQFDVPRDSRVDIVIFNMMGQEVAHPVSSVYTAGRHQMIFDAANLPSGAYVLRMTAGEFSQLSKMMLLK